MNIATDRKWNFNKHKAKQEFYEKIFNKLKYNQIGFGDWSITSTQNARFKRAPAQGIFNYLKKKGCDIESVCEDRSSMICSRCKSKTENRDGTLCNMSYPCQRDELDEEMKKKQKENAFKMYNIFNKEDVKVQIHMKRIPKNNSKAKRLQKYSIKIPRVGNIKKLSKDLKGNLKLFDNNKKRINEETECVEEQGKSKSTRNVLYCNNNKCHRIIKNIDGNFNLY